MVAEADFVWLPSSLEGVTVGVERWFMGDGAGGVAGVLAQLGLNSRQQAAAMGSSLAAWRHLFV